MAAKFKGRAKKIKKTRELESRTVEGLESCRESFRRVSMNPELATFSYRVTVPKKSNIGVDKPNCIVRRTVGLRVEKPRVE